MSDYCEQHERPLGTCDPRDAACRVCGCGGLCDSNVPCPMMRPATNAERIAVRTEAVTRERDESKALAERQMVEKGRYQARYSVLMQAMASLARNGMQEQAQAWVAAADKAAADVRIEDFVVAKVSR